MGFSELSTVWYFWASHVLGVGGGSCWPYEEAAIGDRFELEVSLWKVCFEVFGVS